MATGWRLSTSTSNEQVFTDAAEYDAVFRTVSSSQRLLFGTSSNVASTLAVSSSAVTVNGDLVVSGDSYANSHVVNTILQVGAIADVEAAINNISVGGGLSAGAVTSNVIADSNVLSRHIADGSVTEPKLAGVLSVGVGGTGLSNVSPGRIVVGDGSGPLITHSSLGFDAPTVTLAASNLVVSGSASVGGVPNVETALSNLADGSGILADAVSNVHLADSSVQTSTIADGSVTEPKLAGVLSVSVGGTGVSTVSVGAVPFGDGTNPLKESAALSFDETDAVLATDNYTASNRVHTHDDLVIGAPSGQRFRFFVDADSNLVISSIDSNNTETAYVNFSDITTLLSGVRMHT